MQINTFKLCILILAQSFKIFLKECNKKSLFFLKHALFYAYIHIEIS